MLVKFFAFSFDIAVVETNHISLEDLLNLEVLALRNVVPVLLKLGRVEIVLILWWNKRCPHQHLLKDGPWRIFACPLRVECVKIDEPFVVEKAVNVGGAEPFGRIHFENVKQEVFCWLRASQNLQLVANCFDGGLRFEEFRFRLSIKRQLSWKTLVSYDTHGPNIWWRRNVIGEDDFGGLVLSLGRTLVRFIWLQQNTLFAPLFIALLKLHDILPIFHISHVFEIAKFKVALFIENLVLRAHITMHNFLPSHIFNLLYHAGDQKLSLLFGKSWLIFQII